MKKWSKEQLEAYAAAFRDKDAVYVKGYGWDEVAQVQNDEDGYNCVPYSLGTTNVDKYINSWEMRDGRPWRGYPEDFEENCEIVTTKDYEVQEGDKLVWLGKTQKQGSRSEYTFGKAYNVERHGDRLIYKDDMTLSILARSEKDRWKFWGVIPKWENVKGLVSEDDKNNSNPMDFKLGDIVMAQYTVIDDYGKTETIKTGGIINKVDANTNSCEVVLNNKLIVWTRVEDMKLVFNKDTQNFVETVINNNSKDNFTDTDSEYKALKILLELKNDNIHKLLYRELNKEVMNTMDNLVEGYEFDEVKTIVDAMKSLVFD